MSRLTDGVTREQTIQNLIKEVMDTLRDTRKSVLSMVVDLEEDNTAVFDTMRTISIADAETALQKLYSVAELVHKELDPSGPPLQYEGLKEHVVEEKFYKQTPKGKVEIPQNEYEAATKGIKF